MQILQGLRGPAARHAHALVDSESILGTLADSNLSAHKIQSVQALSSTHDSHSRGVGIGRWSMTLENPNAKRP